MRRLPPSLHAPLLALITLAGLGLAFAQRGQALFSPGKLNALAYSSAPRGGVHSHAELRNNCTACHAPPWSSKSLASRCFTCHTETAREVSARLPIHGTMPGGQDCLACHHEHHGASGPLTDFAKFDHAFAAFQLTGQHRTTACSKCHQAGTPDVALRFKGTPQTCVACHADPPVHRGRFGTDCAACHSTEMWKGAVFAHKFPMNHGGGGKKNKECSVCHTEPDGYRTYTCYGCHKHDPVKTAEKHRKWNISDLATCSKCHPTGRKRPDQPPKGKGGITLLGSEETFSAHLAGSLRSATCPGEMGTPFDLWHTPDVHDAPARLIEW